MSAQIELRFLRRRIEELEEQIAQLEADGVDSALRVEQDWWDDNNKKATAIQKLKKKLKALRKQYDGELQSEQTKAAELERERDAAITQREQATRFKWTKRFIFLSIGVAAATYKEWLVPILSSLN